VAAVQLYLYITLQPKKANENWHLNHTGYSWVLCKWKWD